MNRLLITSLLISSFMISGCSGLIVAGAATGAVASQDRRTVPTQLEDQSIEIKALTNIFKNDELWKDTNISVVSFNNVVLLIGQAPTSSLKDKASEEIAKVAKIKKIHNQIRVAAPISFFASRNDEYLTTKVKSSMLFTAEFSSSKIKVITENGEVFLMGLVNQAEADKAVEIARNVTGVSKVIKVFELVTED